MVKLLTPSDLSEKTVTIFIVPGEYDHQTQKSINKQPMMSGYQTNTFGGTQTFGGNGRPADSDNDSDRNQ